MKRFIQILLAVFLVVGCGKKQGQFDLNSPIPVKAGNFLAMYLTYYVNTNSNISNRRYIRGQGYHVVGETKFDMFYAPENSFICKYIEENKSIYATLIVNHYNDVSELQKQAQSTFESIQAGLKSLNIKENIKLSFWIFDYDTKDSWDYLNGQIVYLPKNDNEKISNGKTKREKK